MIPLTADKKEWVRSLRKSREEFELHKQSIDALKEVNLDSEAYSQLNKEDDVIRYTKF